MRGHIKITLFKLFLCGLVFIVAISASCTTIAFANSNYSKAECVKDFVKSYGVIFKVLNTPQDAYRTYENPVEEIDMMYALIRYCNDIDKACKEGLSIINKFKDSDNEKMRALVAACGQIYGQLDDIYVRRAQDIQSLIRSIGGKDPAEVARVRAEISRSSIQIRKAIADLNSAAILGVIMIMSPGPDKNGKIDFLDTKKNHFDITSDQLKEVIGTIDAYFPEDVKNDPRPEMKPILQPMAAMRQLLATRGFKTADQLKEK